ncbi:hypothetical protein TVAG_027280 [Trichomonas vaginalis G3]|uniref:DUF3447 domain-containing protein n=1 Tax=Trichomonas vaginalis (strain ATCC PRA-98 / G3) TaxID=412133 RepID=A2F1H3_TRIV3|nr:protein of unknown function (DUF3447) [Trichomonas vaginalis G3]EAY01260.1 hypothetical protein TVAG_027280 [Trichomonas vaginalis G3]KAI5487001.1 protein of unknown function (DUF3447) [Trichomonas vaginalis G3]|eukprot:XP_001314075.1 hypothetical protein [Trichomonas vaginalis G3]
MSDQYWEMRSIYKCHINSYNALYKLKTEKEEDLDSIYKMIKTDLIETNPSIATKIIRNIFEIIPYNNRYTKSYLYLVNLILDDYHITEINDIYIISNYLFYKEYGIKLNKSADFREISSESLEIHTENTIYKAIMYDDLEAFIQFTEIDGFDQNQTLKNKLYPICNNGYSLLELCCYHGAVDCFKLLRTKFNSEITKTCLELSFLGGNPDIMFECKKYHEPNEKCMRYAIISHNIDFVTQLMNEHDLKIDLSYCGWCNNLEAFLVYFDQTKDTDKCRVYSMGFNVPSLHKYFH